MSKQRLYCFTISQINVGVFIKHEIYSWLQLKKIVLTKENVHTLHSLNNADWINKQRS